MHMPVNFKLRVIAIERNAREREMRAHEREREMRVRKRESAPAVMRFQHRAETWVRTEFTIDFTFYKVLIIMLFMKFQWTLSYTL